MLVDRYTPTADILVHVHRMLAEKGAIEYPFIQWVAYAPVQLQNFTTFDFTLSQDGRKPEVYHILRLFFERL